MNNSSESSSDEASSFEPGDVPHVLSQIARLGEGLKAEFDLIAGRMSWLVIAESFIFSAFATVMVSYRADHPLIGVLRYLAWVLPFVGMFLAVCVYVAILAALSAVDTLKNQRDRMMAGLPGQLRIDLISAQSRMQWWGNLPTHIIPPVLFLIWAGALAFWHWSRHAGFWSGTGN
jgi:hypothetical protein